MNYDAGLFEALDQVALTDLLGEFADGPALFMERAVPAECAAVPAVNVYRTSPIDHGSEVDQVSYSVNCRADSEGVAISVALAAAALLKRTSAAVGGYVYFFVPSLLPSLPPVDQTDLWNAPVEVVVKARKQ